MTLQNRGRSKKTEGWIAPKHKGGSLAVDTYTIKESVPPSPTRDRGEGRRSVEHPASTATRLGRPAACKG